MGRNTPPNLYLPFLDAFKDQRIQQRQRHRLHVNAYWIKGPTIGSIALTPSPSSFILDSALPSHISLANISHLVTCSEFLDSGSSPRFRPRFAWPAPPSRHIATAAGRTNTTSRLQISRYKTPQASSLQLLQATLQIRRKLQPFWGIQ